MSSLKNITFMKKNYRWFIEQYHQIIFHNHSFSYDDTSFEESFFLEMKRLNVLIIICQYMKLDRS